MHGTKADIIAKLQKDIFPLQGIRSSRNNAASDIDLGPINDAFPNSIFPQGAIHEFFCSSAEDEAVTNGFTAGILSSLMKKGASSIWICNSRSIFPPALKSFGITPDKIIFIDLKKEKDILWATEEALGYNGLAAVVAETGELSFTASRRLQLVVEQSQVTGFIIRRNPKNLATACLARWKINSLPSYLSDQMPGVGYPRWNVELLKIRNGKPGNWQIEWKAGKFHPVIATPVWSEVLEKKTG